MYGFSEHRYWFLFSIKLQAWSPAALLKNDSKASSIGVFTTEKLSAQNYQSKGQVEKGDELFLSSVLSKSFFRYKWNILRRTESRKLNHEIISFISLRWYF